MPLGSTSLDGGGPTLESFRRACEGVIGRVAAALCYVHVEVKLGRVRSTSDLDE